MRVPPEGSLCPHSSLTIIVARVAYFLRWRYWGWGVCREHFSGFWWRSRRRWARVSPLLLECGQRGMGEVCRLCSVAIVLVTIVVFA